MKLIILLLFSLTIFSCTNEKSNDGLAQIDEVLVSKEKKLGSKYFILVTDLNGAPVEDACLYYMYNSSPQIPEFKTNKHGIALIKKDIKNYTYISAHAPKQYKEASVKIHPENVSYPLHLVLPMKQQ